MQVTNLPRQVSRIFHTLLICLTQLSNLLIFVLSITRRLPIHQEAPEFTDMSVEQEILVTGIKVVDLLAPYVKGGKIGK